MTEQMLADRFVVILHFGRMRKQIIKDKCITISQFARSIERYLDNNPIVKQRFNDGKMSSIQLAYKFYKK